MFTSFRGVGSETGGVMLIILGVAGYLVAPLSVARLLTLFIIYFGVREVVAPAAGRAPSILMLVIGVWAALSAYGILGFDFLNSWPLLVVLVGLALIVQSLVPAPRGHSEPEPQP
jgi:hypothetical protein